MVKRTWLIPVLLGSLLPCMAVRALATNFDGDREAHFTTVELQEIRPWFDMQADQWFRGIPSESAEVTLRYKTFLAPHHRSNLLIIHGFGERAEKYQELAYDFFHRGFNVYLYDQRGFGRSSRINPRGIASYVESFQTYTQDAQHFIDQVIQSKTPNMPLYLFGHSMGGLISISLLKERPDLFRAAVLSSPMLAINTTFLHPTIATYLGGLLTSLGFGHEFAFTQGPAKARPFADALTHSRVRWQTFHDFMERPEEKGLRSHGVSYQWVTESLRSIARVLEPSFLAKIQTPILLFQAEKDTIVRPGGQDVFCQHAPKCRKVKMEGAGHEIYLESDDIRVPYLRAILDFFGASKAQD